MIPPLFSLKLLVLAWITLMTKFMPCHFFSYSLSQTILCYQGHHTVLTLMQMINNGPLIFISLRLSTAYILWKHKKKIIHKRTYLVSEDSVSSFKEPIWLWRSSFSFFMCSTVCMRPSFSFWAVSHFSVSSQSSAKNKKKCKVKVISWTC